MPHFFVDPEKLEDQSRRLKLLAVEVDNLKDEFSAIRNSLDWDIRNRDNIDQDMRDIFQGLANIERDLRNTSSFLHESKISYEEADRKIARIADRLNDAVNAIYQPIEKAAKFVVKTIVQGYPPLEGILSYNPKEYNFFVEQLQKRLNALGFTDENGYDLVVDGKFGKYTLEAVNKYKEYHQLWNTGIYAGKVANTTWQHLFENNSNPKIVEAKKNLIKLGFGNFVLFDGWTEEFNDALWNFVEQYGLKAEYEKHNYNKSLLYDWISQAVAGGGHINYAKATMINANGQNPVIGDVCEYTSGMYGNLQDIVNALNGTVQWMDKEHQHAHVTIYSYTELCTYCLDYDLSEYKQGTPVNVKIFKNSFEGEIVKWTHGEMRNGNIVGNIEVLAGLLGISDIQKKTNSIVVNVPEISKEYINIDPYKVSNVTRERINRLIEMVIAGEGGCYAIHHTGVWYTSEELEKILDQELERLQNPMYATIERGLRRVEKGTDGAIQFFGGLGETGLGCEIMTVGSWLVVTVPFGATVSVDGLSNIGEGADKLRKALFAPLDENFDDSLNPMRDKIFKGALGEEEGEQAYYYFSLGMGVVGIAGSGAKIYKSGAIKNIVRKRQTAKAAKLNIPLKTKVIRFDDKLIIHTVDATDNLATPMITRKVIIDLKQLADEGIGIAIDLNGLNQPAPNRNENK